MCHWDAGYLPGASLTRKHSDNYKVTPKYASLFPLPTSDGWPRAMAEPTYQQRRLTR